MLASPRGGIDKPECLAKIHLCMARRVGQRYKHLLRTASRLPNIIRDDCDPAGEPVLIPETFKYSLRRVTLLFDQPFVVRQNLIDDPGETVELWARR